MLIHVYICELDWSLSSLPRPGKHLSMVRSVVERHLLLQHGARPNLYCHYQHPLLSHLSLPLFTRNVERGPGDSDLGPGQLSLKCLWPVSLMGPTSAGSSELCDTTNTRD